MGVTELEVIEAEPAGKAMPVAEAVPAVEAEWQGGSADPLVPMTPADLDLALVLQALSDPVRLKIVAQLADGLEYKCGSFDLPVTKSTCSHHFRVLRAAGVVEQRLEGKCRYNRLRSEQLDERFPGLLSAVLSANLG